MALDNDVRSLYAIVYVKIFGRRFGETNKKVLHLQRIHDCAKELANVNEIFFNWCY